MDSGLLLFGVIGGVIVVPVMLRVAFAGRIGQLREDHPRISDAFEVFVFIALVGPANLARRPLGWIGLGAAVVFVLYRGAAYLKERQPAS